MNHQTIGDHDTVVPTRAAAYDEVVPARAVTAVAHDAAHGAALTTDDLDVLRENLRDQYLFRQEQLRQIGSAAPSRADDLLGRQVPSQLEVRIKVAASARMVLADVEAALRRMDEGRYGACHLCRRPIARERLLIVPQARYCSRCQQVREAGR